MFYVFYGPDDFSLHQRLEEVKSSLGDRDMLAVNTTVLDGRETSPRLLGDACSTVPFLCPARLVIATGLLGTFEQKTRTASRAGSARQKSGSRLEEWRELGDYIKQMPLTTTLVFIDAELKRNNPLLRIMSPLAKVAVFPRLGDDQLRNWVQQRITRNGATISPGAVRLLVEFIGGDLWVMSGEIDKLLAYSSGSSITEETVRQMATYVREANIFTLVDAIIEGRAKAAQRLLHQMLRDGAVPSYILTMITRQLRLIVRARESGQKASRPGTDEGLLPASDYSLEKASKQAAAYTLDRIRKAYHHLLESDIAIKTGKYDSELALDLLVIELCRA